MITRLIPFQATLIRGNTKIDFPKGKHFTTKTF